LGFKLPSDRSKTLNGATRAGERTAEESAQILWMVIDEARAYLKDPLLTPEEKRRWAKTLADTVGVLRKLVDSQGEKQLDDEDLGTLLSKVPRTFRLKVMRRARVWRRKNL
jgi:hypothetical protein